jgi:general secretion pathway protein I
MSRPDSGFTLIEVVVAFSILAVSLGAIFLAFGSGSNNLSHAERYTVATLVAESQLARAGIEFPYTLGEQRGQFADAYRWVTTIRPVGEAAGRSHASEGTQLYEVIVSVEWDETDRVRSVRLRSLRLGELPK